MNNNTENNIKYSQLNGFGVEIFVVVGLVVKTCVCVCVYVYNQ